MSCTKSIVGVFNYPRSIAGLLRRRGKHIDLIESLVFSITRAVRYEVLGLYLSIVPIVLANLDVLSRNQFEDQNDQASICLFFQVGIKLMKFHYSYLIFESIQIVIAVWVSF